MRGRIPHPFSDGKALEGEILRVLEEEIAEVKDGTEPVKLGCVQVCAGPGRCMVGAARERQG